MKDVSWQDNFKRCGSGWNLCIYPSLQVSGQTSLIAASAAAIVLRNDFFHLYQQKKSFESKLKFRQASNRCKRVLEAIKLAYANKTKKSINSQKLAPWDFDRLPIVFSTKVNLLCLLYSTKQNCLLKIFLKTLIMIIQVSFYLFFLLELICLGPQGVL